MDKDVRYDLDYKCCFVLEYIDSVLRFVYETNELKKKYPNLQLPSAVGEDFRKQTWNLLEPEYGDALSSNRFFRSSNSIINGAISTFDNMANDNIEIIREARDTIVRIQDALNSPVT